MISHRLFPLMSKELRAVSFALVAIAITSAATLIAPTLIARTIDGPIAHKDMHGLIVNAGILLLVFLTSLASTYIQVRTMGGVGRRLLFSLRNELFSKLQDLPVSFFTENKVGDLISRINNDTDKLNQFFSQALIQFLGNAVLIVGAGVSLIAINTQLGLASLVPALAIILLTQALSPWIKRTSLGSLQSLGGLSGEIQESLSNFKVVVAFDRLDYFREKFTTVNEANYVASIKAGVASNTLTPLYALASTFAQLIVLVYGISLIAAGNFTVVLLVGYLLYVNAFYMPLRQVASIWSSMQLALAGLDRIGEVLELESDLLIVPDEHTVTDTSTLLTFDHVSFYYVEGKDVLRDVCLELCPGKTYALVGPTGGGKTTTASLMARLFDPTAGTITLNGRDIRSYTPDERAAKIGYILQEPFLFTGSVQENILYGNCLYDDLTSEQVTHLFAERNLSSLLERFDEGLDTHVSTSGNTMSLGQKQLIAFMRAVLRDPEILILDEATANIDTVTEELLEDILRNLPKQTTKVIIAHRLNTIEGADVIYFVNNGTVMRAGNKEEALAMLLEGKRGS